MVNASVIESLNHANRNLPGGEIVKEKITRKYLPGVF